MTLAAKLAALDALALNAQKAFADDLGAHNIADWNLLQMALPPEVVRALVLAVGYATHKEDCGYWDGHPVPCDCGWDAALAALDEVMR